MTHPVDELFTKLRAAKRCAFAPFLPAGDPDLAFTRDALFALRDAGADLIELGVPFSDPIADGPVIQASYGRALGNGFTLEKLFAAGRAVTSTAGWATPVVAMASYSLIWKRGPARFVAEALGAGIAGAVVPDLPIEEAGPFGEICRAANFALTLLVTPTTSPERMARIVAACSGFVYVVSVVGITGDQSKTLAAVPELLARLRRLTDRPLCVGFGVSRPAQVAELAPHADGVIVGTALVRVMEAAAADRAAALRALAGLARDLRAPLG